VDRRILFFCCVFAGIWAGAAQAAVKQPAAWATPSIRAVTNAGLMGATDVQSFRAADPLTAQALENLVFDLKARVAPLPEDPAPTITDPTVTDPAKASTKKQQKRRIRRRMRVPIDPDRVPL